MSKALLVHTPAYTRQYTRKHGVAAAQRNLVITAVFQRSHPLSSNRSQFTDPRVHGCEGLIGLGSHCDSIGNYSAH